MARDEKMKTQLLENCKDVEVGTTSARRDVYCVCLRVLIVLSDSAESNRICFHRGQSRWHRSRYNKYPCNDLAITELSYFGRHIRWTLTTLH